MPRARSGLIFVAGFLAGVLVVGFARPVQAPSAPGAAKESTPVQTARDEDEPAPIVAIPPAPAAKPPGQPVAKAQPRDDGWRNGPAPEEAEESPHLAGPGHIGGPVPASLREAQRRYREKQRN
jgi:hypothetical protein